MQPSAIVWNTQASSPSLIPAFTHPFLRLNSILSPDIGFRFAVVSTGSRLSRLSRGKPHAKFNLEVGMGGSDHLREHCQLTRRYFVQLGCAAAAAWSASPLAAANADIDPQLQEAIARLEYLTPVAHGRYSDKGKAGVLKLPAEKLSEIGLVPETWFLEVVADTASSSVVERPLTRAQGNAWTGTG